MQNTYTMHRFIRPSAAKLSHSIPRRPLIIDRGHVAHGRAPHILATNSKYTIEGYISAGKTVLEKYFAAVPTGAWPKLMTMRINRGA